jgi:hypothetical protein
MAKEKEWDNCLVLKLIPNLITNLDDPIIIQVGYQYLNTTTL